jgi:hypothetical protein
MFQIAMESRVGNGNTTLFWRDNWLTGKSISEIAPLVVEAVPAKIKNKRTVAEAMVDQTWTRDVRGGLSLLGQFEFFLLVDALLQVVLTQEEDVHVWRLDASGQYTSKSTYRAFFNGSITFEPWRRIWKSWAPAKCKIFLWLAARNRCWTADRLALRNLPHPDLCLLCDQEEEDIQHLLTTCVFAREFWCRLLSPVGLQHCVPSQHASSLVDWWRKSVKKVPKEKRKGFNTLIILGAWLLWKHRNACVFEGAQPCMNELMRSFHDKHHLWGLAGARSLLSLSTRSADGVC